MTIRPLIAARLLLRFLYQCAHAGFSTARIILRRTPPQAGLVRLRFASTTEREAALLGALLTLTPGSTIIDIDMERSELLLHLLDVEGAEDSLAGLCRTFERDIHRLFPKESS
jgi:multicomponent K+:H+ antiporter subunit E/multicomponent Na+:H+ antiporter subunit E